MGVEGRGISDDSMVLIEPYSIPSHHLVHSVSVSDDNMVLI